jgi:mannose-6-phosphate isomerase-like protein (cupin superfamily)
LRFDKAANFTLNAEDEQAGERTEDIWAMQSFLKLEALIGQQLASGQAYHEFLRVPAMSSGIYVLRPGAVDAQRPHAQDEIYYVIAGAAHMTVYGDERAEDRQVGPRDIIFVKAGLERRFHEITRELVVLVTFAPAESPAKTP